jgi:Type I phosphodiesterase / nucleotide pyrophosphatase
MRRTSRFTGLIVALAVTVTTLVAQPRPTSASRPDLVVVISIDQFPYNYITRFQPLFGTNGFKRFLRDGAVFVNARYPYAITFTGPGHASIGTGYPPSQSGIAGNNWWVGDTNVYCVDDKSVEGVVADSVPAETKSAVAPRLQMSPKNLLVPSLGEKLVTKDPVSRVYSVSLKDRAAILMGGHIDGYAAYWYDEQVPGWASSTYYRGVDRALLEPVDDDLSACDPRKSCKWELAGGEKQKLAPYVRDPDRLRGAKSSLDGMGQSFPHPITTFSALTHSPFGNGLVLNFARRLIEKAALGADNHPDILYISLSAPDYLGHRFGPDSFESADTVLETDRDLGAFFDWLQERFPNRVTVALTADHGVQPIPEVARDRGLIAGRVDLNDVPKGAVMADLPAARLRLEQAAHLSPAPAPDADTMLIAHFEEPWIYLDHTRLTGEALERAKRNVRDESRRLEGVSGAWTDTQLREANPGHDALEEAVRLSFNAARAGDVFVTLRPGYIWNYSTSGTTHGQPVEDDQHVPLLFWGAGIRAGTYDIATSPLDIAKTLGALLGVDAGGPESKALPCVTQTSRR